MRVLAGWVLATAVASAGPKESFEIMRRAFYEGNADAILKRFAQGHGHQLGRDPHLSYALCRYAADGVPRLRPVDARWDEVARRVALVAEHIAVISKDMEAQWSVHEAAAFKERLRYRGGVGAPDRLRQAAKELARSRRPDAYLRAVELTLEAAHYKGSDRAKALSGLLYLQARLKQSDSTPPDVLDCAQASIWMEEGKIAEALALLEPHLNGQRDDVVRRHNDLVTLAKAKGIDAKYHLVPRAALGGHLKYGVPLSRAWRIIELDESMFSIWQLAPDGTPRREIVLLEFSWDENDGKNVVGVARRLFDRDKATVQSKVKTRGPGKTKLGKAIPRVQGYEVSGLGKDKSFRKYRGFFFRGADRTFGIHVTEHGDLGKPGPSYRAFLATFDLGK
ncbi:MAG: hypothetical protein O7E54_01360 [Planctomycetota bacterium]|nr:hypothetical protein [Planctomycetota bacterium]